MNKKRIVDKEVVYVDSASKDPQKSTLILGEKHKRSGRSDVYCRKEVLLISRDDVLYPAMHDRHRLVVCNVKELTPECQKCSGQI